MVSHSKSKHMYSNATLEVLSTVVIMLLLALMDARFIHVLCEKHFSP